MTNAEPLQPPPGLSGGIWGTTTYVGPLTWACAVAALPTVVGWMIILLFCPLDKTDVYKVDEKLYTVDGKVYKAASSHNFCVTKSEHVVGGVPPGCSPNTNGSWGTTQHVGPLTWSLAICAFPTVIGSFLILLFMPLDNDDVYKDADDVLYLADGTKFKAASSKNFDVRRSAHTTSGTPEGLSGGTWGTTTYVGPLTFSLALAALPTIIGSIVILLFCPLDQEEVYNVDDKLYLPSGELFKAATKSNFFVRKSEHTTGTPKGMTGGEWGTTTYVGPLTFSFAFVGLLSGVGWIVILLLLPLDSEEVYKTDEKLYLPDGELYKAASSHNFYKKNSKHVQGSSDVEKAEKEEDPTTMEDGTQADGTQALSC
mmetsp:Transcript_36461/g.88311  ORF Transcript_36461/g.88311 Transcript_36461/m.88311 type:complete len:369 (+) Transcript_36461:108-1214(+)